MLIRQKQNGGLLQSFGKPQIIEENESKVSTEEKEQFHNEAKNPNPIKLEDFNELQTKYLSLLKDYKYLGEKYDKILKSEEIIDNESKSEQASKKNCFTRSISVTNKSQNSIITSKEFEDRIETLIAYLHESEDLMNLFKSKWEEELDENEILSENIIWLLNHYPECISLIQSETISSLEANVNSLNTAEKESQTEIDERAKIIESLEREIICLNSELEIREKSIEKGNKKNESLESKISENQILISDYVMQIESLNKEINTKDSKINHLESNNKHLTRIENTLAQQLNELKQNFKNQEGLLNSKIDSFESLSVHILNLEGKINSQSDNEKKLKELENKLRKYELDLANSRKENCILKQSNASNLEAIDKLQKENEINSEYKSKYIQILKNIESAKDEIAENRVYLTEVRDSFSMQKSTSSWSERIKSIRNSYSSKPSGKKNLKNGNEVPELDYPKSIYSAYSHINKTEGLNSHIQLNSL